MNVIRDYDYSVGKHDDFFFRFLLISQMANKLRRVVFYFTFYSHFIKCFHS